MTAIPAEALDAAAARLAELLHQSEPDAEDKRWAALILGAASEHFTAAEFYLAGVKAERVRIVDLIGEAA